MQNANLQDNRHASSDDILSRLVRLEVQSYYERQALHAQLNDMSRRLWALESAPQRALDAGGYLKCLLALALPLTVFLITGSLEKAVNALALVTKP